MTGRKPTEIDHEQLEKLARLHCTIEEAAAFFGCARRTLLRHLKKPACREAWERGRVEGKLSLRRLQWLHANGTGSSAVAMTMHLSRLWLDDSEKSIEPDNKDGSATNEETAREILARRLSGLAPREGEEGCAAPPEQPPE